MIQVEPSVWSRILFGIPVMELLEMYEDVAGFYSPDVCFVEAERYILHDANRRGLNSALARSILKDVSGIIQLVDKSHCTRTTNFPLHFDKSNRILPVEAKGEQCRHNASIFHKALSTSSSSALWR